MFALMEAAASLRALSRASSQAPSSGDGRQDSGLRSVGIKVLNNRLSEYVRLASSGETVLVTDRDRVVAEIGPPRETRSPMLADAMLADAMRKGWLTPPVLPVSGETPPSAPVAPLRDLIAELESDRSER